MNNTNYFAGVVKVLESPKQKLVNKGKDIKITQFRAQFPQARNKSLMKLTFWGNLALDVLQHYKINDYLLIEGYLSLKLISKPNSSSTKFKQKKVGVTVIKVYPFLLNNNHLTSKS